MSGAGGSRLHAKFVWDSVFFSRIALCGYEYEQYYAFFPFLPGERLCLASGYIVQQASSCMRTLVYWSCHHDVCQPSDYYLQGC